MKQQRIAIIGASGAIGMALANHYAQQNSNDHVIAFTRATTAFSHSNIENRLIDFASEDSLADCANRHQWDLVIIAIGILTDDIIDKPEKSFKQLSQHQLEHLFTVNTIYPALTAKYFMPQLVKNARSVLAIVSARIGSISDNRLGGWHAYRASKAALNMLIKNFAIEMQRVNQQAIIIGLHPGTVDSKLSKPFQKNISPQQLFSPPQATSYLVTVIENATHDQSGSCIAWDGSIVEP